MTLPPFLTKLFMDKGKEIASDVIGGLDSLFTSKEEKLAKQIELTEKINSHLLEIAKVNQAEVDSYLKDMDSARQMQVSALSQGDTFSKRFIYYFTIGLTVLTFAFNFCFFWIQYPERNHDIVNMIAGVINTGCLVNIINFFYGSSKSSEKKQEVLEAMAKTAK